MVLKIVVIPSCTILDNIASYHDKIINSDYSRKNVLVILDGYHNANTSIEKKAKMKKTKQ